MRTRLLAVGLATVAVGLTVRSVLAQPQWAQVSHPALLVAIVVTFFVAEQSMVHIEFRRQSHALTIAGVPLVVGALGLPVYELTTGWLVGAVAAFFWQRISYDKILYNAAAYTCEAAVVATAVHGWLPDPIRNPISIGLLIAGVAVVDQVMSLLVLWIIRIHGGVLSRSQVLSVLALAAIISTMATIFAVALAMLIRLGPAGIAIVVLLVGLGILGYRAFAATSRRHQSLQLVHEFVADGVGAQTRLELAYRALDQMCELLRATRAELVLAEHSDDSAGFPVTQHLLRLTVTEDGQRLRQTAPLDASDWVRAKALHHGAATLAVQRTKDVALIAWLQQERANDALVAPVLLDGIPLGTVTVFDRLGDLPTFTHDDLHLLQTLNGHLAVALQSTQLVERLSHEATHDSLTGLANRASLSAAISASGGQDASIAVMLLDLDKFKEVNDVLGHDVGDRLLVVVAERLTQCLPRTATVARLGGDEFAVLLRDLGPQPTAAALALAEHAVAELNRPVQFDEALLTPEASIGVALLDPARTANLLRCADTAMYNAKATRQGVVLYHPDMDRGRAERLALLADLRVALDAQSEQFSVYYQPKVDLANGAVVSAEALVRWNHPSLGVVSPDRFVPLAETSGLIDQLTVRVLGQALTDCARWRHNGIDISVAVNLSAGNLTDPALPDRVARALAEAGVPADRLILEITESSAMGDPAQVLPLLARLTALGVVLSLDDFGTGYSSLAYLQELPVRELKIDRCFITRMSGESVDNARALVAAITALGASLGLRVVAEGVETVEQQRQVIELGCHIGQGYLFSRPLPPAAMLGWLQAHHQVRRRLLTA